MTEQEALNQLKLNRPTAYTELRNAIDVAIESLEKQIPKKVDIQKWIYTNCECGYEFSKHHGDGYYSIPHEKKTKYCPNCGQKLDWNLND